MTVATYNAQLARLTQSMQEMGAVVCEMVLLARESLVLRDASFRERIQRLDWQVNQLDQTVHDQATHMLASHSPMGDDLRFVTSAFSIASDLEHAGDLAKNIAKRSLNLGSYLPPDRIGAPLRHMTDLIHEMLTRAMTSVGTRDEVSALDVWRSDKQVDDLYHDVLKALQDEMHEKPDAIEAATHFMFADKNLERIADYATSIARTVYYVVTGNPAKKSLIRDD